MTLGKTFCIKRGLDLHPGAYMDTGKFNASPLHQRVSGNTPWRFKLQTPEIKAALITISQLKIDLTSRLSHSLKHHCYLNKICVALAFGSCQTISLVQTRARH